MPSEPMIISPQTGGDNRSVRGVSLVIQDWSADGLAREVAPLHVHRADDEAWHVISGALRFRFENREFVAGAGSTVLVPAGVPHTFGHAGPGPSRFILILPARLDELIGRLHQADSAEHPAIYRMYESALLE